MQQPYIAILDSFANQLAQTYIDFYHWRALLATQPHSCRLGEVEAYCFNWIQIRPPGIQRMRLGVANFNYIRKPGIV